jgi:hypothetical protein
MRTSIHWFVLGLGVLSASSSSAPIFGTVSGAVEDPQHQPVAQARITIRAPSSGRQDTTDTDLAGRFVLQAVPIGDYEISAAKPGFQTVERSIRVRPGTVTNIGFALPIGAITETVDVVSTEGTVNTKSVTTESLIAGTKSSTRQGRSAPTAWTW